MAGPGGGGGRSDRREVAGHFAIKALGERAAARAYDGAYALKAGRLLSPRGALGRPRLDDSLVHAATVFEIAAIDQWGQADGSGLPRPCPGGEGAPPLGALCRECFGFLEECSLPDYPADKFGHIMQLFAYACLGDRWEAMRRYVDAHAGELDLRAGGAGGGARDDDWEYTVMSGICNAFLLLAGGRTAGELRQCVGAVESLRKRQGGLEGAYLEGVEPESRRAAAHRLAAMYHLARSVELLAGFLLGGSPSDAEAWLEFHLGASRAHAESAGCIRLEVSLRAVRPAFTKMVRDSAWAVVGRAGGGPARLVESLARSGRPVFELLYPQRMAVLDGGLLDPVNRAMVLGVPASGGKTLLAELRILQDAGRAAGGGGRGVAAYAAPTGALVRRAAAALRRDLGPLGMRVEAMGSAMAIDGFEDCMLAGPAPPDVIVATPEKLLLLLQSPGYGLAASLSLCIVDGADGLGDGERGVGLEMLASTVRRRCARSALLLLAPPVQNGGEMARWIDPGNPKYAEAGAGWRPNGLLVGAYYAEGRGRRITTRLRPLPAAAAGADKMGRTLRIGTAAGFSMAAGRVRGDMHALTSLVATQLDSSRGLLVLADTADDAWSTAGLVYENLGGPPDAGMRGPARAAGRFVAGELGAGFPLARYLERGIGVRHDGIPCEINDLMDALMEAGRLRVLVATADAARGPCPSASGILVSSSARPGGAVSRRDFWRLLGRAGRIDQPSLGVLGVASDGPRGNGARGAAEYAQGTAGDVPSRLAEMVEDALSGGAGISLAEASGEPGWSGLARYIAHEKVWSGGAAGFAHEAEIAARGTFAHQRLGPDGRRALCDAAREYGEALDKRPRAALLSVLTGLPPEAAEAAAGAARMGGAGWGGEGLFEPRSGRLKGLIGAALDSIPGAGCMAAHLPGGGAGGGGGASSAIAGIAADWVGGRAMPDIARARFGGDGLGPVTACVRSIHGGIARYAAWGLAAMQSICALGRGDKGGGGIARPARNLPAMLHYGVDTDEAVLMRMNSVPRCVAGKIGTAYADHLGGRGLYEAGCDGAGVAKWLEALPDSMWEPESGGLAGSDCKAVWRELAGAGD